MKKTAPFLILAALLLCLALPAAAQRKLKKSKPDLNEIKATTLDPESPYYFPRLVKIYNLNDTTMTPEQYRHYYLGYMFQEDYDPYRESQYAERTDSLLQLNREAVAKNDSTLKALVAKKESPFELDVLNRELQLASLKDRREIVKNADLALKDNPFDLNTIYLLNHVLKDMKKDMSAKIWDYRLENLLGAILSTGTGLDKENAFYVISPGHEYVVLELMGYRPVAYSDEYFNEGYDYIEVESIDPRRKRADTPKGFFFNVQEPLRQYSIKYPDAYSE